MSLSSLLAKRNTPVREWFESNLPNLKPVAAAWKAAGPLSIDLNCDSVTRGFLGAAIDYRIRYFHAVTDPEDLAAARSRTYVFHDDLEIRMRGEDAYSKLAQGLREHLAAHDPVGRQLDDDAERALARYCYLLGIYESIYRSGRPPQALIALGPSPDVEDQLALCPESCVEDLVALGAGYLTTAGHLLGRPAVPNPTFAASDRVGGADADLLVDGLLLEIKTTTATRPDRDWSYQLLGYLLLDLDDAHAISDVGFYLPRVPALLVWPADDLLTLVAERPVNRNELRGGLLAAVDKARPARTR